MGAEVIVIIIVIVLVGVGIGLKVKSSRAESDVYSKPTSDRNSESYKGKGFNNLSLPKPTGIDQKAERNSWNHKTSDGERNSLNYKGKLDRISDKNKNSDRNSLNVKSIGERTSGRFKPNSDISSGNKLVLDDPNVNEIYAKLIIRDPKEEDDEEITSRK